MANEFVAKKGLLVPSGNIGIGTNLNAWSSTLIKALQIGNKLSLFSLNNNTTDLANNLYFNGTEYIYQESSSSLLYRLNSGSFQWFTAPSGTAGNIITLTQVMTLTNTGNLGIGTTSPNGILTIKNPSVSGEQVIFNVQSAASTTSIARLLYNQTTDDMSLVNQSNGSMAFLTNNTERMRITSSGSVGIGTTSPYGKLNVAGAITTTTTDFIAGSTGTVMYSRTGTTTGNTYGQIQVGNNGDNGTFGNLSLQTLGGNVGIGTTTPTALLQVLGLTTLAANTRYLKTHIGGAQSWGANSFEELGLGYSGIRSIYSGSGESWDLAFSTGTSTTFNLGTQPERMRITSIGEVLIGTTSSIFSASNRGLLEIAGGVNGSIVSLKTNTNTMAYYYADTSDVYLSKVAATGGRLYLVNVSGGLYLTENATTWTSSSDERLKNITGIIDSAVDKLMTLRAVNFSWKSDNTSKENLGLIAQDVEKVFPQIIDKNKLAGTPNNPQKNETEYLGVRYQELIPILVKAVQELKQEIETLKNK